MKNVLRHKSVVLAVALLLCLLCNRASGQVYKPAPYKFSSAIYNDIKKDSGLWRGGITSTDLSFIGLYKEGLLEMAKAHPYKNNISDNDSLNFITAYKPANATEFILQVAQQNQILIFNEAHHNPRNRVFVTSLLAELKKCGFNYFAAEAFTNNPYFNNSRHPDLTTGFYTAEPQFGNMIREAVRLNYTLYPYEDTTGANGKEREISQAKNLQTLLKRDPKAKIIIYCGYAHLYEGVYDPWEKAMAGRLKEYTGIDPYTVDQVELTEKGNLALANPYFKLIHSGNYAVLTDKSGKPFNMRLDEQHVDALLYTPPTTYIHNRPGWIFENNKTFYFLNPNAVTVL